MSATKRVHQPSGSVTPSATTTLSIPKTNATPASHTRMKLKTAWFIVSLSRQLRSAIPETIPMIPSTKINISKSFRELYQSWPPTIARSTSARRTPRSTANTENSADRTSRGVDTLQSTISVHPGRVSRISVEHSRILKPIQTKRWRST
jgi:hypothetical protein